ncbi:MarR family winged helix-turn-helix transcriptional regulator [Streptomyces pinistramenti]|uniref:MarR family winged helix-turn-helix transcriptional regulator n=1 Tax=Streptomyces pinistramenti TaxID=2884812 RepID=UPI001D06DE4B|nr:MarR family transcriptional regulator [Streptomyces pinistramenti]MCB5909252.1 MarR family transcriptional regulator [Streptomyces pinistramenti]
MEERDNGAPDVSTGPDASAASAAGVEELAQAADALFYAMRRARSVAGQAGSGLTLAQLALLDPLATADELPVGRLAAAADVSVPTATRMLQQLEGKGSVHRQRSPTDERRVLVTLTEEGRRQLAAVRARLRERQTRTLSHIPPDERARLTRQLHGLADAITALDA